jgi:hypothetical protein
MTTLSTHVTSVPATIPLLDASDLPYADDWAVLEAIAGDGELGIDAEPDLDRFGQFRVSASFDE